jgi:predicted ATPase
MSTSVVTQQAKSNLKAFSIIGLFGTRNVSLKFDKPINILLGENGLGKTTTLNALYYTLTGNFSKLNAIHFEKIVLGFKTKSIEISKSDLELIDFERDDVHRGRYNRDIFELVESRFSRNDKLTFFKIVEKINSKSFSRDIREFASRISDRYDIPSHYFISATIHSFGGKGKVGKLESVRTEIQKQISEDIIYFPTYRRIEEELHNLGSSRVEFDKKNKLLIQFGMKDVKATLDEVLLKIKNSAISGFSKITGDVLEQYVVGLTELDPDVRNKIKPEVLKIILERIGENISQDYKDRIIELVISKNIFEEEKYRHLINFLSKLIAVYEEQGEFDNSIKGFAAVCNKYLYGKRLFYNESKVQLTVAQLKDGTEIELGSLSSGEKQIISLFAKLYFESNTETIILFDEPELSLSMEWQRMLLPDVLASSKCNLLLTVTHSPFVFDNELDRLAEDMAKYVVEQ